MDFINHLALRIAAATADEAAFLIGEQAATLGALPGYIPGQALVFRISHRLTTATRTTLDMFLQNTGDGISTGEDSFASFPGDGGAADAS